MQSRVAIALATLSVGFVSAGSYPTAQALPLTPTLGAPSATLLPTPPTAVIGSDKYLRLQREQYAGENDRGRADQVVAQNESHEHDEHEKVQTHIHDDEEIAEYGKPDDLPPDAKLFRIFFDSGSATLSDEAWSTVEEAVLYAQELSDFEIFVEGYTDTVGNLQVNHKISHARAKIVRKALGLSSLPLDTIHITDYGESRGKLLVQTGDDIDESQNRRVEITVISPHEDLHAADVAEHGDDHDEHHDASDDEPHYEEAKLVDIKAAPAALINVSLEAPEGPLVEGQGSIIFRLKLDRPAEKTTIVSYTTLDGTAKQNDDYEAIRGTLRFAPGEMAADIRLDLIDDGAAEEREEFKLFLSGDRTILNLTSELLTVSVDDDD